MHHVQSVQSNHAAHVTKGNKTMTNANIEHDIKAQEINKLLNSIVATERKADNTGTKLACVLHELMTTDETLRKQAKVFSEGAERKHAANILAMLCSSFSYDYREAYADTQNKDLPKETRGQADKVCKAIRKAMTRSLYIASWAHGVNASISTNKRGEIVLNAGSDYSETYSLRSAETNAKRYHGRIGNGAVSAGQGSDNSVPMIPVTVAMRTVINELSGREEESLGKTEKQLAHELLFVLAKMFEADEDFSKITTIMDEVEKGFKAA